MIVPWENTTFPSQNQNDVKTSQPPEVMAFTELASEARSSVQSPTSRDEPSVQEFSHQQYGTSKPETASFLKKKL